MDKIQAALKAALSVTRGDLDGFKQQLAEIPVKLAEIAAAESELEEFEEQRAAKADLLEVEDVALIDVQSMLDHIAQADEEEAQRREQEAKDKMEREEQERIEEEVREREKNTSTRSIECTAVLFKYSLPLRRRCCFCVCSSACRTGGARQGGRRGGKGSSRGKGEGEGSSRQGES